MDGGTDRLDETPTDGRFRLADGRLIGYRSFGTPEGRAVLALHGTPGSRLKFSASEADAITLGLRVIAPDRWGYGLSDVHPKPSLAAFAGDMQALADGLELDAFGLMGVSGGGPYAAATAALMGPRITALALVSPVGPIAGAPAAKDLSALQRFSFLVLPHLPGGTELIFRIFGSLLRKAPDKAMTLAMSRAADADRALMKIKPIRDRLAATFVEGLRPGAKGPAIDLALFGAPWRVPLADISAPAHLWIGTQDRNVPRSAARGLAALVPGCSTTVLDGEGHLWVATHYGEVLHWLSQTMNLAAKDVSR